MSDQTASSAERTEPSKGSRSRRAAATVIDLLILGPTSLFIMLATGIVESAEAWVMPQPIIRLTLLLVGSYLLLNGYLLVTNGQTLGKRLLGLRIQSATDGALLPFPQLLLRTYALLLVSALIAPVSFLIAFALLFSAYVVNLFFAAGKPQRCLHDYLAGSVVVRI